MSTKRERDLVQRLSDEWDKFIWDDDDDLQGLTDVIVALRKAFDVTGPLPTSDEVFGILRDDERAGKGSE